MPSASKVISRFRVSDGNLERDQATKEAYGAYSDKRYELGKARKALNEASKKLHDLLDGPLRSTGLVPQGKDWTLTEDEEDLGLIICVWSEPRQRGRKKPELPIQQLSFPSKGPKAA